MGENLLAMASELTRHNDLWVAGRRADSFAASLASASRAKEFKTTCGSYKTTVPSSLLHWAFDRQCFEQGGPATTGGGDVLPPREDSFDINKVTLFTVEQDDDTGVACSFEKIGGTPSK